MSGSAARQYHYCLRRTAGCCCLRGRRGARAPWLATTTTHQHHYCLLRARAPVRGVLMLLPRPRLLLYRATTDHCSYDTHCSYVATTTYSGTTTTTTVTVRSSSDSRSGRQECWWYRAWAWGLRHAYNRQEARHHQQAGRRRQQEEQSSLCCCLLQLHKQPATTLRLWW